MEDPGFIWWMIRIRKALRREFEARAATSGITAPQVQVLYRLWQGDGLLTSVLTREISSDGGTITGLLDRLEARGLIRRERSREDRRAVLVYLTDAGRALEAPMIAILNDLNAMALRGFDEPELEALRRAMARIAENLKADSVDPAARPVQEDQDQCPMMLTEGLRA